MFLFSNVCSFNAKCIDCYYSIEKCNGMSFFMLFSLKKKILLFQEIELPDPKNVKEERALVVWNSRLTNYFKSSPCYLEEIVSKGKHGTLRPLF